MSGTLGTSSRWKDTTPRRGLNWAAGCTSLVKEKDSVPMVVRSDEEAAYRFGRRGIERERT